MKINSKNRNVTIEKKNACILFEDMKFLIIGDNPVIQVSKTYMDVNFKERSHRILNKNKIPPGFYTVEKNHKYKITIKKLEKESQDASASTSRYTSRYTLNHFRHSQRCLIPSIGSPLKNKLPEGFEELSQPYPTHNEGKGKNKNFGQCLSLCFHQITQESQNYGFLIDMEFLKNVIEVPLNFGSSTESTESTEPAWTFQFILPGLKKELPVFCFVSKHEISFRLALISPLRI